MTPLRKKVEEILNKLYSDAVEYDRREVSLTAILEAVRENLPDEEDRECKRYEEDKYEVDGFNRCLNAILEVLK